MIGGRPSTAPRDGGTHVGARWDRNAQCSYIHASNPKNCFQGARIQKARAHVCMWIEKMNETLASNDPKPLDTLVRLIYCASSFQPAFLSMAIMPRHSRALGRFFLQMKSPRATRRSTPTLPFVSRPSSAPARQSTAASCPFCPFILIFFKEDAPLGPVSFFKMSTACACPASST